MAVPASESAAASSSTSASAPSSTSNGTSSLAGDTQCAVSMCISAIVNSNSTVTYILQSTNKFPLGWMAMGFGTQMANSPMVIMWTNSDGSITLSQREAPAEVMPTVVNNPPNVATLDMALSDAKDTSNTKFAFTIQASSSSNQNIIYAFGTNNPGSSSPSATLIQHVESAPLTLNLQHKTGTLNPINPGQSSGSGPGSPTGPSSASIPFQPYEKRIIAHAVFSAVGFIVCLPLGALVARWLRMVIPTKWFRTHAGIQFWISGPLIIIGFALAVNAVQVHHSRHFDPDSTHKVLGLILFCLYIVLQIPGGAFIHFVKNPKRTHRPTQNYAHVLLGLIIIGLSFWQVWLGFDREWNESTGRGKAPRGVFVAWIVWMVVLGAIYALGLVLVPAQYRRESEARVQAALARKVEQPHVDESQGESQGLLGLTQH